MTRAFAVLLALAAAPALAADILIQNAKVHTVGSAGTLEHGSVLIRDHRIAAVGKDVAAPAGAQVIDAAGRVVTPGIFAAYTQLGLHDIDAVDESADDATTDERFGATLDAVDSLNPRAAAVAVTRVEGVTRAVAAPMPGERHALIAGYGAVIDLGAPDAFVTRPRAALFMPSGETAAQLVGGTRSAGLAWLREVFEQARDPKRWAGKPTREPLLTPLEADALQPVLTGKVPLVVSCDRASDLRVLMKLAADYRLKLVVQGGVEAHLVAKELAEHKIPVLMDPATDLPARFETVGVVEDNAARLQRAGVQIAFVPDGDATMQARNLRQLAGLAVARGLPWDAALAAITLNPARIYGVDGELGSLEKGKLADLVIWDGDPFELTTYPVKVFIDGREVSAESRQTLLRDRYLPRINR